MSSTPRPSKRPRHSQSTSASTLRAPFKSPLRPRDSNAPPASPLSIPTKHAATTTTHNAIASESANTKVTAAPCQPWRATSKKRKIDHHHVAANSCPAEQRSREEEGSAAPSPAAEDDLTSLQRTHTRLLNTLAASKRDLETARQAQKLESSSSSSSTTSNHPSAVDTYHAGCAENERLKDLIGKWRAASREAAEVVYASAKARVECMGGMRGIRAREVDKWRWFREEERAEQGVEKRKMKVRERKVGDMDEEQEEEEEEEGGEGDVAEAAEEDGEQDEDDDDDEGGGGDYTMGMMLQGFGIQPKTLGWDDDGGKWID